MSSREYQNEPGQYGGGVAVSAGAAPTPMLSFLTTTPWQTPTAMEFFT
jgi:hypothetical protein